MTIDRAFLDGWYEGAMGHGCRTPREAETRHPDWTSAEITAHLNGVDDGERNDTFRRDYK